MKKHFVKLISAFIVLLVLLSSCSLFDSIAPEITAKSPTVEYGTTLSISDIADITDNYPGAEGVLQQVNNGKGHIDETGSSVSFDLPGEYTVVVVATDARNNKTEAECPISVVDTTCPVIVSVPEQKEIEYGKTMSLGTSSGSENTLEVQYEDVSDVSLSISSIQGVNKEAPDEGFSQDSNDSVTFSQVGEYTLSIDVTDAFGNRSTAQTRVSVVDLTKPVISGLSRIVLSEYDALPSLVNDVVATDEIDGDLTGKISVDFSTVKKGVPGTYSAIYSVSDAAGNTVREERVVLIEDTTPPVITTSQNSVSLTVGDEKPDYKSLISASDTTDGNLSSKVVVDDSNVNYSTPGTYEVKYTVSDKAGNTGTKTIKVAVRAKATPAPSLGSGGGSSNVSSGAGSSGVNIGGGDWTVYVTKTGSKYHTGSCRYLSRSKIPISRSGALAQGYTACSVCRPG